MLQLGSQKGLTTMIYYCGLLLLLIYAPESAMKIELFHHDGAFSGNNNLFESYYP
jgi:hypothetical protein